jgi:hypothetical protein
VARAEAHLEASLSQRMSALRRANRTRALRTDARRAMSRELACELVMWPEAWARGWSCARMLRAVPGMGAVRVRRTLRESGVGADQVLGELTRGQREALRATLLRSAPSW